MTWEDCFYKPKLLLAAKKLIYLNISISISKIHGPHPLEQRHSFFTKHSYLPLEKLPQDIYFNAASFAKIITICENNYSPENNERFIVDVRQGSEYASGL